MVVSIARHSEGSLAARDTGLFKLTDSRGARTAESFDETLQCLERALESRHYSRRTIQAFNLTRRRIACKFFDSTFNQAPRRLTEC